LRRPQLSHPRRLHLSFFKSDTSEIMDLENDELDIMQVEPSTPSERPKRRSVRLLKDGIPAEIFYASASADAKRNFSGGLKQTTLWQSMRGANGATISEPPAPDAKSHSRKRALSDAGPRVAGKKSKKTVRF
jgi:hypothetical protein